MGIRDWPVIEKLFKGQKVIFEQEYGTLMPDDMQAIAAYNKIAVATQCIDLIVDYAAPIEFGPFEKKERAYIPMNRADKIENFLDFPNQFMDNYKFWSLHYMYLLLYGNSYIVLEKDGLYLLYPPYVEVVPDQRKFIKEIKFGEGTSSKVVYKPEDVAVVSLNKRDSQYIGNGVLDKLSTEINLVNNMLTYHKTVMKTGGVHKYAFTTENILGEKIKTRIRGDWKKFHTFASANQEPPILEGGLKLERINVSMADLDFNESVKRLEVNLAVGLGVPPELLVGETNANLEKTLKKFMLSTVLPLVNRTSSALTLLVKDNAAWFKVASKGTVYIRPELMNVLSLREDSDKLASTARGLYTTGLVTKNEARVMNGLPKTDDSTGDEFLEPANIAGSAIDPGKGGAPKKEGKKE